MPGHFELFIDIGGQYRFRLRAANGEIILASEDYYRNRGNAEKGIRSVRDNAPLDERYERKTTSDGKHMFNLKEANHEVIGTSEAYETRAARDGGIESVKTNAPSATIEDKTQG